jgi:hypothetical protein
MPAAQPPPSIAGARVPHAWSSRSGAPTRPVWPAGLVDEGALVPARARPASRICGRAASGPCRRASEEMLCRAFLDGGPFVFTGPERWNALGPRHHRGVRRCRSSTTRKRSGDLRLRQPPLRPPPRRLPREPARRSGLVVDLFEHADQAAADARRPSPWPSSRAARPGPARRAAACSTSRAATARAPRKSLVAGAARLRAPRELRPSSAASGVRGPPRESSPPSAASVARSIEKDYRVTARLVAPSPAAASRSCSRAGPRSTKGFGLIDRFSEDLDLKVEPGTVPALARGVELEERRSTKATAERRAYFEALRSALRVTATAAVEVALDDDADRRRPGAGASSARRRTRACTRASCRPRSRADVLLVGRQRARHPVPPARHHLRGSTTSSTATGLTAGVRRQPTRAALRLRPPRR